MASTNSMPRYRFKMPDAKSFQVKRRKHLRKVEKDRKKKVYSVDGEIEALRKRLWPDLGEKKEDLQPSDINLFKDLPMSKKTLAGLDAMNYTKPTDIQRESLLFALKGHDILGAAKTGSGKTLAFLLPILETLFRLRYTPGFGLAALIISPTRELAYQSYDVLRKLGKPHHLSYGLAIGGMFLHEEAEKIQSANVLICTPGRLLQHFEQTPNFSADELKVLVLDEADKILEMGFKETMDNVIEALPRQRQTLLFSATQTKSVKSLARLSLKKPIYISAHEKAKEVTPKRLNQRYVVCEMQDKFDMLWSFLKSHHRHKVLVFLSSCKQVRYLAQAFKKLNLGMTTLCIHGHMKQLQRVEAYELFSRKRRVIMLATDVAARGLDFPTVDWIVQLDKPENVDTYIHRVGRTARYDRVGDALLVLLPSEEEQMLNGLKKKNIPIVKMHVAKKKLLSVGRTLASHCASDLELKGNASKAFTSAMKTLYVLDKKSFNEVDTESYAGSMGLVQVPKLPFLPGAKPADDEDGDNDIESSKKNHFQKKTLDFNIDDDDDDKDDEIYTIVKSSTSHLENGDKDGDPEQLWIEEGKKAKRKKGTNKEKMKLLAQSKLVTFDEDGNPEGQDLEEGINVGEAIERLKEEDKLDKEAHRKRIKEEHREQRLEAKQERKEEMMERMGIDPAKVAVLGNPNDSDDGNADNDDVDDDDDEDGPRLKKQRMESYEEAGDDDDSDDDDDNDDEEDDQEDDEDSDNDEDDDSDAMDYDDGDDDDDVESGEDDEGNSGGVEQDEAAVLALLKGKR